MDRLHEERFKKFDRLLLETSGAENPEIFRHLFLLWDMPQMYSLSTFITVLDAEYGDLNLDEFETAVEQIALADTVLLNKSDLVAGEKIRSLEARIRGINPVADIMVTEYGDISMDTVEGVTLYKQLSRYEGNKPYFTPLLG